jgi:transcriptional regulator with XRE-family HTH domain
MPAPGSKGMTVSPALARELFASRLRAVRQRSGRTLRELQTATYASDSALSRYLSGKSVPPWNVVAAMCDLAGTDPADLRQSWQLARATRRTSTPAAGQTLRELHTAAAAHLSHLAGEIARSIQDVQARGEQVPVPLLALEHHSAAAFHQLRAAQRLTDSACPTPAQPGTTDLKASTDGGTKK